MRMEKHRHGPPPPVPSWAVGSAQLEDDEIARVLGLLGPDGDRGLLVREVRAVQGLRGCLAVGPHHGGQRALRRSLTRLFRQSVGGGG